jgi:hypothetical protein
MTPESKWRIHLKVAIDALSRSQDAPDWLKLALQEALAVAPQLAPRAEPQTLPPAFFYPH